jgi:hopanoid biosynthesis associated protein HpnK
VNEAVELAHTRGILTAASLMTGGAAVDDAVMRARRLPRLRVGLHLVLVDGAPLLPPSTIPDLVDADGRFPRDLARAGRNIFLRRSARVQLAAEITAQFAAFHTTGLALDHVNAHHHFHLHPGVSSLVLEIGLAHGLRALRVPAEPQALLARIDAAVRRREDWRAAACRRLLARRVRRAGLMTPASVFGLAWSGAMTESRIAAILEHLPDGISEIYTHPATSDRFPGASGAHADEFAALMAPRIVKLVDDNRVSTGGYSDFLGR